MSGTDKTKPYYVKLWDGDLTKVAVHDRRFGECTLPATLADVLADAAVPRAGCFWDLHWTGIGVCSCHLCTGRFWHQQDVRRDRRTTRERLRGVRAAASAADDLADL